MMSTTSRLRVPLLFGIVMVATMALSVSAAIAQPYPPDADFGVACVPADPAQGADVSCEVVGAVPGEALAVTAEAGGDVFFQDAGVADENGVYSFGFTVPADATGDVIVRVVGSESGEIATAVLSVSTPAPTPVDEEEATTPIAATPPSTGTLPMTGGQVTTLGVLGLALIGAGLVALRRREDASTTA